MPGRLFLVATPIGNLGDVSARALQTLREVRLVACEDTRHSTRLLQHHGVHTPTFSLSSFDEQQRARMVVERLQAGEDVALVTDAGTPGVSDPGEAVVAQALAAGVEVVPIPGPSAVLAALSASGLPTKRFHFLGFLPRQPSEAQAMLEEVAGLQASLVLYESPRRLGETLTLLGQVLGDRQACVARELTKLHETFRRGKLSALAAEFGAGEVLGEVTVVVAGRGGPERWTAQEVRAALREARAAGERLKKAAQEIAGRAGWMTAEVYRLGLEE